MHKDERHVEKLATYVHGSLTTLHTIALLHNIRRRNWIDTAVHGTFIVYDLVSTYRHYTYIKQSDA